MRARHAAVRALGDVARARRAGLLVLALLATLTASCGYSAGLRVPSNTRNVGLEFFGNDSLERDLERSLHDQMTRALRDYTELEIVPPKEAKLLIRGKVRTFQRRGGVRSTDNVLLETGVYIAAEAQLVDPATNRGFGPVRLADKWVGYILDDPQNEREARDRTLRLVAEQLVLDLFSPVD